MDPIVCVCVRRSPVALLTLAFEGDWPLMWLHQLCLQNKSPLFCLFVQPSRVCLCCVFCRRPWSTFCCVSVIRFGSCCPGGPGVTGSVCVAFSLLSFSLMITLIKKKWASFKCRPSVGYSSCLFCPSSWVQKARGNRSPHSNPHQPSHQWTHSVMLVRPHDESGGAPTGKIVIVSVHCCSNSWFKERRSCFLF